MLTKNTDKLRTLVAQHVADDQVIRGVYWDAENQRGCFIGCLNHSADPTDAEQQYGLPIMVQRIAESIFESLPTDEARAFFAALPDAVHQDGKDLSRVSWQFLAEELWALPPQPPGTQSMIRTVIAGMDLLANGQEWSITKMGGYAARASSCAVNAANATTDAARAASYAAYAAAFYATDSARAAFYAAYAANATTDAAWAAFYAASYAASYAAGAAATADAALTDAKRRQRDLLLRLIAEAPVV